MDKLRAGVIGLGMGGNHLRGYLEHPDVEVVAIADRRDDRRALLPGQYPTFNGKIYHEGIEMIRHEQLDIVSVAVPNNQHKDLTIAALESGANVLCEKPMAMNTAEAQEMLDTAKRCGKKLGIDFSYRFTPQSRAMKELVESGILGNIYYARTVWLRRRGIPGMAKNNFNTNSGAPMGSWFFNKAESGGGPLIDLGVHRLDLALWLMGYPEPSCVMGSTYCALAPELTRRQGLDYTVEDFACAMIKFKNGATLELDASWASNIRENEQMSTRLLGEKGGLYQYNLNETYRYDVELYQEIDGRQYDTKLHTPCPEPPGAFQLFVDAVRDDTPFLVQPEEGVTVMRLLDAIYESNRTGKPVIF
ncbi:MAG: Gfo/Idh/MocA family oxidoreductase [Lentisphaeria bacterium]|nr:Gfo/Idh/MocA family oxidoreductase [Lentisphaeria bacterium]